MSKLRVLGQEENSPTEPVTAPDSKGLTALAAGKFGVIFQNDTEEENTNSYCMLNRDDSRHIAVSWKKCLSHNFIWRNIDVPCLLAYGFKP
jgi:hypothetical protein